MVASHGAAGQSGRVRLDELTAKMPRQSLAYADRHLQMVRAPDVRHRYPDPRLNYRHGLPFGLTTDELRAEWRRQSRAGWSVWELNDRLRPSPCAA